MRNEKCGMRNSECGMRSEINKLQIRSYSLPELEIIELDAKDIITTSLGTETTPKDNPDGIWDLELG